MSSKPHAIPFVVAALALSARPALAQSTALTYQGRLTDAGAPAEGLYDLRFRLFDATEAGRQVGETLCADDVDVVDGLFTVILDFDQQFATPQERHLEIEVRRDTGLNCNNASGFAILSPRQELTAAPRATHARSAFSLAASDGLPLNAVVVGPTGKVGIGVAEPGGWLDIQGTDNSNVLFGRRTGGGLAHNLFIDGSGNGSMQLLDFNAVPRINLGAQDSTYFNYGNVGIGTTTPLAKLDVRGDIRLGNSGQFSAPAGVENLRIVRGTIAPDGGILAGAGFRVNHPLLGIYIILFNTPFAAPPTVTATFTLGNHTRTATIYINGPHTGSFVNIAIDSNDSDHEDFNFTDRGFNFIAIGPR